MYCISTTKDGGLVSKINPWICALGFGVKQNSQKSSIGIAVKIEGPEPQKRFSHDISVLVGA